MWRRNHGAATDEPGAASIAYEHAKENLAGQRARLDNLRTRAAAVVTAAAVVASFLGGQAFADTKLLAGTTTSVPDRSLEVGEAVAFAAFLSIIGLCAWIIRPKNKGWTFRLNARKLLLDWVEAGASREQTQRELAAHMEDYYAKNEPRIEHLFLLLQISLGLLAVQAAALMFDLIS